jgi:hypothetical protein
MVTVQEFEKKLEIIENEWPHPPPPPEEPAEKPPVLPDPPPPHKMPLSVE